MIHADPEHNGPEPEWEGEEESAPRGPDGPLVIDDVLLGDPGFDGLGSIY